MNRRLAIALLRVPIAALVAVALAWLLAAAAPGGLTASAARAEGREVNIPDVSPDVAAGIVREVADKRGLDDDVISVVARSLGNALTLDFGRSWRTDESVVGLVAAASIPTVVLLILVLAVGLLAGIGGALRVAEDGAGWLRPLSAVLLAVPPVWIGIVALAALSDGGGIGLLPRRGWGHPLAVVLPTAVLVPAVFAVIYRHTESALREFVASPAALAARARGLSVRDVARRHGLRFAVPTLAPLVTSLVAYLLGAFVVIERLFDIRGLGWLLVDAAGHGDVPVLVCCVAVCASMVAGASVLADVVILRFDPRVREPS